MLLPFLLSVYTKEELRSMQVNLPENLSSTWYEPRDFPNHEKYFKPLAHFVRE